MLNKDSYYRMAFEETCNLIYMLFESKHQFTKEADFTLAAYITCDLFELLEEKSISCWPRLMPHLLNGLHHSNADIRHTSAFALNCASKMKEFAPYVTDVVQRILAVCSGAMKFPKKHDDVSSEAVDNMVSALYYIMKRHEMPINDQVIDVLYNNIPLLHDTTEGLKVHKDLLDALQNNNPKFCGPQGQYVGTLIGKFSEIYLGEASDDDLNLAIKSTFGSLGNERLAQLQASFTDKQKRKIERVLKDLN